MRASDSQFLKWEMLQILTLCSQHIKWTELTELNEFWGCILMGLFTLMVANSSSVQSIGNESVPKIIINNTLFFSKP